MILNELFKNTNYDDTLFSDEARNAIEESVFFKNIKGKDVPYIKCLVRGKEIKLTPEEAVRQLYLYKLMHEYGYPADRIELEAPIHFGREVKRADIVISDKDRPMVPYIIVELKKPKLTDGKEQLKSYCNATGAPIGVWTNGEQVSCYLLEKGITQKEIAKRLGYKTHSAVSKRMKIMNKDFKKFLGFEN